MPKLHALLIGINEYHPKSRVSSLDGCVNDVEKLESFLTKHYQSLQPNIRILKNAKATRDNIIRTFQDHLITQAKPDDTVLFAYSGHGSYSQSARAFWQFDPKRQDETLVCYDSRLPEHYDLTDKELAVLLSRIHPDAHTVAIVDACHSASITRSGASEFKFQKSRFTKRRADEQERPLESYLLEGDNYYADQWEKDQKLHIPKGKYIVFSACDRDEEALETYEPSGLFSSHLLKALEKNRYASYADLFLKVRQAVTSATRNQLPILATHEGFDPNSVFLSQKTKANHRYHRVHFVDGKWRLDYGAIHGLPTQNKAVEQLKIGIYAQPTAPAKDTVVRRDGSPRTPQQTTTPIQRMTTVGVNKVLLKEVILDWDNARHEEVYQGAIENFPAAMPVNLVGTEQQIEQFNQLYENHPSPFLFIAESIIGAKYSLVIKDDQLLVERTSDDSLIHGAEGTDEWALKYILGILEQIEEWERVSNLQNPMTRIADAIEMVFVDESDPASLLEIHASQITLDYPNPVTKSQGLDDINYHIKVRNTSQRKLRISLLYLGDNYSTHIFYPLAEIPAQSDWIVVDNDKFLHIDSPDKLATIDIYKLIVSTDPFDDYKFFQEGFTVGKIMEKVRSVGFQRKTVGQRKRAESDWCTNTITINVVRTQDTVGKQDITFPNEQIVFKGHPTFAAKVAFAPLRAATRSVHPAQQLADYFKDGSGELIDITKVKTRGTQDRTIIELSEIEDESVLTEQPLEIEVTTELKENEYIIPITYDGEFVIPLGRSSKNANGSTTIQITDLPAVPDEHRKRSVKKALWFCLLKVVGLENKAFRLRKAQLNKVGDLVRSDISPTEVDKAKKILLVIHGIIGDTEPIGKNLAFLVDPTDESKYDLMLTFDYENLRTKIEDIADTLNTKLNDLGLNAADGKQLDIIAHSMGGLVSRHLIEKIRKGDGLVNRLFMFGTPNGGSPFGDIPGYIELYTTLLSTAINFSKPFLAPAIAYLEFIEKAAKAVNATKHLTITLDQMSAQSPFTQALANPNDIQPTTTYFVIAGDSTRYLTKAESRFARFSEKVLLQIGERMNQKLPNDIAVGVEQILAIPPIFKATEYIVTGHHLNYFVEEEAMGVLRGVI